MKEILTGEPEQKVYVPLTIRYRLGSDFSLYPINRVKELLHEVYLQDKRCPRDPLLPSLYNSAEKLIEVRFVLDTDNRIWLALEGSPGKNVPGHAQMTGVHPIKAVVHYAGTFLFNSKGKLAGLTNKSGDFRCEIGGLNLLVVVIAKNEKMFNLAKELKVICFSENKMASSDSIAKKDLMAYAKGTQLFPSLKPEDSKSVKKEVAQETLTLQEILAEARRAQAAVGSGAPSPQISSNHNPRF